MRPTELTLLVTLLDGLNYLLPLLIQKSSKHGHLNLGEVVLPQLVLDYPLVNRILVSELNLVNRERDFGMLVKDALTMVTIDQDSVTFPERKRLSYPPLS